MRKGQLAVCAEGRTKADIGRVWSLLADANRYAQWGPWSDGGYRPASPGPSKPGDVQWFRYGRRTVTVERILEVEAPSKLVYSVIGGLPVKGYRAGISLLRLESGDTYIRWAASWDRTLMGLLIKAKLQRVYHEVMAALIRAAEGNDPGM